VSRRLNLTSLVAPFDAQHTSLLLDHFELFQNAFSTASARLTYRRSGQSIHHVSEETTLFSKMASVSGVARVLFTGVVNGSSAALL
jgi:hypothetical protein